MVAIHVLQNVMHGDNVRTWKLARRSEKIGDVNEVATQALELGAALENTFQQATTSKQWYARKIRRERPDLRYLRRRSDQKIFVRVVEPAECAHHVARVSANAELGEPPQIDGNLHWDDLTTVGGKKG